MRARGKRSNPLLFSMNSNGYSVNQNSCVARMASRQGVNRNLLSDVGHLSKNGFRQSDSYRFLLYLLIAVLFWSSTFAWNPEQLLTATGESEFNVAYAASQISHAAGRLPSGLRLLGKSNRSRAAEILMQSGRGQYTSAVFAERRPVTAERAAWSGRLSLLVFGIYLPTLSRIFRTPEHLSRSGHRLIITFIHDKDGEK